MALKGFIATTVTALLAGGFYLASEYVAGLAFVSFAICYLGGAVSYEIVLSEITKGDRQDEI